MDCIGWFSIEDDHVFKEGMIFENYLLGYRKIFYCIVKRSRFKNRLLIEEFTEYPQLLKRGMVFLR